jgi:uncharacterized protein YabN with tetrapyrrole methylase and pyrophosphatase domain
VRRAGAEKRDARKANDKFQDRFETMEHAITAEGHAIKDLSFEDLDARWNAAKETTKARRRTKDGTKD